MKYLVSREAGLRLKSRLKELSKYRSDGKVIIVLRRHDQWIASHYRRYLKNGGSYSFDKFLDLDTLHPSIFGRSHLSFMNMIHLAEYYFDSPPLVLFQEELTHNLEHFLARLTTFTGTVCDPNQINPNRLHRSYDAHQLKVVRRVGATIFNPMPTYHPNPALHRLQRRSNLIICHIILALARLVPKSQISTSPLIPPEHLERVHEETADDWAACIAFARAHNPTPHHPILV